MKKLIVLIKFLTLLTQTKIIYHGENFSTTITSGIMKWSPEENIYTPDHQL